MAAYVEKVRQKFEDKFMPEPNSGCWLWLSSNGGEGHRGYGRVYFRRKQWLAHRVSWTLYRGEIPDNLYILHKCDMPRCVNPDHLFVGTLSDNSQDMVRKGRVHKNQIGGDKHPCTIIPDADIPFVLSDPRSAGQIAKLYGVDRTTIQCIRRGRSRRKGARAKRPALAVGKPEGK